MVDDALIRAKTETDGKSRDAARISVIIRPSERQFNEFCAGTDGGH